MKRILVVEDELEMSNVLRQVLEESGYSVVTTFRGDEGLVKVLHGDFDLAILDVMLPVMDGFELLKKARAEGNETPVLFLTARDRVQDRVEGLDLGADDYLAKPFQLAELLARVRARLRRGADASMVLECGDLRLDVRSREVTRGKKLVYLSATEFTLLELLLRRIDEPVSKQEILQTVWHDPTGRDDNVVEVYVNYLRNKIERTDAPRLLQTVRGKGYMITCSESAIA